MRILAGRENTVTALAFSPDSVLLAAAGLMGGVHVWDTHSGALVAHFDIEVLSYPAVRLLFMSTHALLVPTWSKLYVCDAYARRTTAHSFEQPVPRTLWQGPDDAHGGSTIFGHVDWQRIEEFRLADGVFVVVRTWTIKELSYHPVPTLSSDKRHFFAFHSGHPYYERLGLHAIEGGNEVARWRAPAVRVEQLTIDHVGKWVAGRAARTIYVWDIAEPKSRPRKLETPSERDFTMCALHPEGMQIATLAGEKQVRLWDTRTLELQATMAWNLGTLHSVIYAPDGTRAAVGTGSGKVLLWDVE